MGVTKAYLAAPVSYTGLSLIGRTPVGNSHSLGCFGLVPCGTLAPFGGAPTV